MASKRSPRTTGRSASRPASAWPTPPPDTVAEGIRTQTPGQLTWPIVRSLVRGVELVSEAELKEAVRFSLLRMKLLAEPSGAVPLAWLLSGRAAELKGERVGVIISGGNANPALLASILAELSDSVAAAHPGAAYSRTRLRCIPPAEVRNRGVSDRMLPGHQPTQVGRNTPLPSAPNTNYPNGLGRHNRSPQSSASSAVRQPSQR